MTTPEIITELKELRTAALVMEHSCKEIANRASRAIDLLEGVSTSSTFNDGLSETEATAIVASIRKKAMKKAI